MGSGGSSATGGAIGPGGTDGGEDVAVGGFPRFDHDRGSRRKLPGLYGRDVVVGAKNDVSVAADLPRGRGPPDVDPFIEQRDAMALRKGDAKSVQVINDWIAARKADGWLPGRFHYWFETREWLPLVAQN